MPAGACATSVVGQRLGDSAGEEAGVRVGERVELRVHRRAARPGGRGRGRTRRRRRRRRGSRLPAASMMVAAVAGDGHRRRAAQVAVEDVGHGGGGRGRDAVQFTPAGRNVHGQPYAAVDSPAPRMARPPHSPRAGPPIPPLVANGAVALQRGRHVRCRAAGVRGPMVDGNAAARLHGAAVRGRVGWSSLRAAVAGVARGPWPPRAARSVATPCAAPDSPAPRAARPPHSPRTGPPIPALAARGRSLPDRGGLSAERSRALSARPA